MFIIYNKLYFKSDYLNNGNFLKIKSLFLQSIDNLITNLTIYGK